MDARDIRISQDEHGLVVLLDHRANPLVGPVDPDSEAWHALTEWLRGYLLDGRGMASEECPETP